MTYYAVVRNDKHLEHHGIKGQKWGVRRFQNEDGSLTAAGRERYGSGEGSSNSDGSYKVQRSSSKAPNGRFEDKFPEKLVRGTEQYEDLRSKVIYSWDGFHDAAESPAQKALQAEMDKKTSAIAGKEEKIFYQLSEKQNRVLDRMVKLKGTPEYERVKKEFNSVNKQLRIAGDNWAKKTGPIYEEYKEKMLGQVLKDLGYEDTPEGRKRIKNVVFLE